MFSLFIQFQNITLSVNDLLACCGFRCGDGCDGGYPIAAWQYFSYSGVVTEEVNTSFSLKKILNIGTGFDCDSNDS